MDRNSSEFNGHTGHLDGVIQECVAGWAWNSLTPDQAVYVDIYINGDLYQTVKADQFRQDLLEAGIGNGAHGFIYPLGTKKLDSNSMISVRLAGTALELCNSPTCIADIQTLQQQWDLTTLKIDPYNIKNSLDKLNSVKIKHLLIDINDTCNINCVYCPNVRSSKRIELENFQILLARCLEKVDIFQIGCGQEPTADIRLPEFYRTLQASQLRPGKITMITNATLLHRQDISLFQDCGLTELQISLDTVDSEINTITRRGAELSKISENLQYLREKCPDLNLVFSVVIHALTLDGVEALIDFGDSFGVIRYYIREIFDHWPLTLQSRNKDYRDWLKKLSLQAGEFQQMQNRLKKHPSFAKITFIPSENLGFVLQDMQQAEYSVRRF